MHKYNSAWCYFVFTYGRSRNKVYEFIGENCVVELLNTLKMLAGDCTKEMKKHTELEISRTKQRTHNFKCLEE